MSKLNNKFKTQKPRRLEYQFTDQLNMKTIQTNDLDFLLHRIEDMYGSPVEVEVHKELLISGVVSFTIFDTEDKIPHPVKIQEVHVPLIDNKNKNNNKTSFLRDRNQPLF